MIKVKQIERKGDSTLQDVTMPGLPGVLLTVLHRKLPEFSLEAIKGVFSTGGFKLEAYRQQDNTWRWKVTHQERIQVLSGSAATKEQVLADAFIKTAQKYDEIIARAKAKAESNATIARAFRNMGYDPKAFGFGD